MNGAVAGGQAEVALPLVDDEEAAGDEDGVRGQGVVVAIGQAVGADAAAP